VIKEDNSLWDSTDITDSIYCLTYTIQAKSLQQISVKELIYGVLFRFMHFFISEGYTAQDRQLLKRFCEELKPIISEHVMKGKDVSNYYFLTIMES